MVKLHTTFDGNITSTQLLTARPLNT